MSSERKVIQDKVIQTKVIQVVGAALYRGGELLLFRRLDQGKLEFPGGKLEAGETLHQALGRELEEELWIDRKYFSIGELLGEDQLVLPTKTLKLSVFWVPWPEALRLEDLKLSEHSEVVALSVSNLEKWSALEPDILPLDRKLAAEALQKLAGLG